MDKAVVKLKSRYLPMYSQRNLFNLQLLLQPHRFHELGRQFCTKLDGPFCEGGRYKLSGRSSLGVGVCQEYPNGLLVTCSYSLSITNAHANSNQLGRSLSTRTTATCSCLAYTNCFWNWMRISSWIDWLWQRVHGELCSVVQAAGVCVGKIN